MIAEMWQTSDITYRIYDLDRVDDQGNKRQLHTEEALAANDYEFYPEYKSKYDKKINETVNVVRSEYFTTNILDFRESTTRNYHELDSFVIHVCVEGEYKLIAGETETTLKKGECVLIPASIKQVKIETGRGFKILESYLE